MIRKVTLRRFKRFEEVTFDLPGHVVLAGPNNCGKTTLLQAVATWAFTLRWWQENGGPTPSMGNPTGYTKIPVARQAFAAVPLRSLDLLFHNRHFKKQQIEIGVTLDDGRSITMELIADTTEQIYVRPKYMKNGEWIKDVRPAVTFVPPMTGLVSSEPRYADQAAIDERLAQGRPGEVLRNLLLEAERTSAAWDALTTSIRVLFGFGLKRPQTGGASIIVEYEKGNGGPTFDIASAGSGFQQVLMLLTFLHARPGTLLLVDEPDAHLHMILQEVIYGELRRVAEKNGSKLMLATHSEVIIDTVERAEVTLVLNRPRRLSELPDVVDIEQVLRVLSNTDIMLASEYPRVLYVEDYTDLFVLREWARILKHPSQAIFSNEKLLWKPRSWTSRPGMPGRGGSKAEEHFAALKLVSEDMKGLLLVDGDNRDQVLKRERTQDGLLRLVWTRYEIESYLFHPDALRRVVHRLVGESAPTHIAALDCHLTDNLPPAVLRDPLGTHDYLNRTKARTDLLPPALRAAGLDDFPYTEFWKIAEVMLPEEIHPEVTEKLDKIAQEFLG